MAERINRIDTYLIKEARRRDSMDFMTMHRINIDYHKKDKRGGWYRQVGSMDGFINRLTKRFSDYWYTKEHYHLEPHVRYNRADHMDIESLKIFCNTMNKSAKKRTRNYYPTIRWMNWATIWDFFDYIGYDHKNKSVKEIDKFISRKEK
jgi:hypothetical protein